MWPSIGNVCDSQGKYEEALEYYQNSLDIKIRVFGSDHPDVATSFINIGAVYAGKGDLENALVQYQKGLEIQTRVFGSDHHGRGRIILQHRLSVSEEG